MMLEYQPGQPASATFVLQGLSEPGEALLKLLTLNNDGTTSDMRVDGSTTPKKFQWVVPAGKLFYLRTMELVLVDVNVDPLNFGALAALTNGVSARVYDVNGTTVLFDMLAENVKALWEFTHFGDVRLEMTLGGATTDLVVVTASMHDAYGFCPVLTAGQIVQFTVNDNLSSGLDAFEATITGRIIKDRR